MKFSFDPHIIIKTIHGELKLFDPPNLKKRREGERRKIDTLDPWLRAFSVRLKPKEKLEIWGPEYANHPEGDYSFLFRDRRQKNRRKSPYPQKI